MLLQPNQHHSLTSCQHRRPVYFRGKTYVNYIHRWIKKKKKKKRTVWVGRLQEGVTPFPKAAVAVPLLFGIGPTCFFQPLTKVFLILLQYQELPQYYICLQRGGERNECKYNIKDKQTNKTAALLLLLLPLSALDFKHLHHSCISKVRYSRKWNLFHSLAETQHSCSELPIM